MTTELIIFSAIMVASVIAHYIMWRDSKKRHLEILRKFQSLMERMTQLEANYNEMDGVLDAADEDVERIGREIDAMRASLFLGGRKTNLEN